MATPRVRTIRLRWRGRCCVCGHELPVGELARWDSHARTATCLHCAAWSLSPPATTNTAIAQIRAAGHAAPSTLGVAGGSALREYERRRAARERRARERAGTIGVWRARLTGDPASTRSWKQGADGEAKVAARLGRLLEGTDVHLLHDRRLPERARANIDHIAVGAGGVTVIDAKTLSGKVRVEATGGLFGPRRRRLRVKGRDRTRLVYGVRAQAEAVRALLAQQGAACEVRCALCFPNVRGLPLLRRLELEGVVIDGPRRVAKLAARSGPLDAIELERIVGLLAIKLPSA